MVNKSPDEVLNEFSTNDNIENFKETHSPVTFWIPNEYKEKYSKIQKVSKNRFSRCLSSVICASIDKKYP